MSAQKGIEDQPRYVIDEDLNKPSETKILPEEQARVLKKLLKASGGMLPEEERDLVYRLLDKLEEETKRIHSLQKMTVGDKPLDEFLTKKLKKNNNHTGSTAAASSEEMEGEEEELAPLPTKRVIVGFKPEELVRHYIECWNQQKFGAEHECFSRDFIPTERSAYVEARQKFYHSQIALGGMKINFGAIEASDVQNGEATVVATKAVVVGNRKPVEERDRYRLKLTNGKWHISGVEPIGR